MKGLDEEVPADLRKIKAPATNKSETSSKSGFRNRTRSKEHSMNFDHFTKPSGVSDEEGIRRAVKTIGRAVNNGKTEVEVCAPDGQSADEPL